LIVSPILLGIVIGAYLPAEFFYLSVFLIGTFAGAQFPLAAAMADQDSGDVGRTAGLIDWADHLGALVGAALTGIFLIPVFGLPNACFMMAALKAATILSVLSLRLGSGIREQI